jgi:flagellar hook-associated protein 3 FlgL
MRISTSNLYETGIGRIGDLQSGLAKTQEQLSTNRRILTPADDPVAASRALDVTQAQAVNTRLGVNRQNAKDSLNLVESTLGSVTSLLQDAKYAVVQAGNGGMTDADRATIATDLSGRLEELVGLANTQDASGNYLFSGYSTSTKPFTKTATGATYNGDQGQRLLQVGQQRQIALSDTGQNIFQAGTNSPKDVFKTLTDLINVLQTPGTTGLAAGLATANDNIDAAINNVLTTRTTVGSHLKELDSLDSTGEDLNLQYQTSLSSLQDLDYAKAISELTQQQVTLQAAQQSFVKISGLSLFNYLN